MCGICGEFRYRPGGLSLDMWNLLVDRMWRRGPDDRGVWHDGEHCLLGCRRLAVIDPSPAGHLPMVTPDGNFALAFNGELYNFRELRRELQSAGYSFVSHSDAEVALRALEHWGEHALDRFNGMFALAFHARRDRTLLLARDHAGIKPLYVLRHPEGIAFSSELDLLFRHPWSAGGRPAREAVEMYLRLGYVPAPLAWLDNTSAIEPGTWWRVSAGGREEKKRYFHFAPRERSPADARRAVESVDEVVARAVRRQTVTDVPIGSFLSGGIDSPLVAACMAGDRSDPIDTFAIGFEESSIDESDASRTYATLIGTRHHQQTLRASDVHDLFDDAISATCEPLADEGIFPTLAVSKLARQSATVALSGEGGDELFWGYVPRQQSMMQPTNGDGRRHTGHRYLEFFAEFRREQFADCFPGIPWWPDEHPFYSYDANGDDVSDWLRWNEFHAYLPFVLLKTDRASMFHSLEVRVPLLDREVIEVAALLDYRVCADPDAGLGKLPLRRALRRSVGWDTPGKKGFTAPMDAWIRGPLRDVATESCRMLGGLESIDVDVAAVQRMLQRHMDGAENNGMALWRLLLLHQWTERKVRAR